MSWTLIEHQALTSSVASVTLGSGGTIPQTYKTLKLLCTIRNTGAIGSAWVDITLQFNGSSSGYSERLLYGNGSSAASLNRSSQSAFIWTGFANETNTTANTFSNFELTIPNYSSTTANKVVSADTVTENNAASALQALDAGLWANTTAITSIYVSLAALNIASGSTFTLYGLA